LSVIPGDAIWNPSRLLNDIHFILAYCGSLIIVDEEERTIRLVHHSVKQFLLGVFKDSTNTAITINSANKTMADIIITYLNYGVFDTQLSTTLVPRIPTMSVPSQIIRSTLDSASSVQTIALKLLKSSKQPGFDIGTTLAETGKLFSPRSRDEFHFYSYAKVYWPQHICRISEQEPIMYNLLLRLFKGSTANTNATDEDGRTPLSWAAENGNEAVVKVLLETGQVDADSKDNDGRTPLSWAAQNGNEAVVKVLLETGKVDADLKASSGQTPLSRAAQNGNDAVVKMLLETGKVDADSKDYYGRTPLSRAAENGHEAVVKVLLETGKVDADSKDTSSGQTPLSWAAQNGNEAVVKVLLETGKVDADSNDYYGRTPLSRAAQSGHEAIVKVLLETGKVDADSKDTSFGQTPLSRAAQNGHEAVVNLLKLLV
jgi:ankyrin repeat protein